MAYKVEKNGQGYDIVINGFEGGVADSPYKGIADIRGANITSIEGEASVNFKTSKMTLPPAINAGAFTVNSTTDIFTYTPGATTLYNGCAIVFNTIVTSTGFSTGIVYYVGNLSGSTFQIFIALTGLNGAVSLGGGVPVNVGTANGSGTFTTYQLGKPIGRCLDNGETFSTTSAGTPSVASYIIDSKNQVWLCISNNIGSSAVSWVPGSIIFVGNISSSISAGSSSSIAVWKGYLWVIRSSAMDYWTMDTSVAPASAWAYGWAGLAPTASIVSRRALVAQDDALYFCNGGAVASVLENAGGTFVPGTASTYTANGSALELPNGEKAVCLAELGRMLLVGGVRTLVYPWDRVSTSYNYPLVVPERYISALVSTNANAYIFAGNRGNIYITNGANIQFYKAIPDHLSGTVQPFYLMNGNGSLNATTASATAPNGDAIYLNNKIYLSFVSQSNTGTTLTTTTGLWAIDLTTDSLCMVNPLSYGTYAGQASVIVPDQMTFGSYGEGVFVGWVDGSGNTGVDDTASTPYTAGETIIDMDMIPVGTYFAPYTPLQLEWKTSVPIGNNGTSESISLYQRKNLSDVFTLIGTTTIATAATENAQNVSNGLKANFQKAQWVQLRAVLTSNATTPTYCRLTELRMRTATSN